MHFLLVNTISWKKKPPSKYDSKDGYKINNEKDVTWIRADLSGSNIASYLM